MPGSNLRPGAVREFVDETTANLVEVTGVIKWFDVAKGFGFIKTATISFGQAMPDAAMRRAQDLTQSCELFLAIGSSLVVWPAAGFPLMAKRNGARLVIINREPTEFDDLADLVMHHDIGDVLGPFIAN